jgi:putative ABC transport system permease protein
MRKQMRGSTDFSAEIEAHIRIEADRYRAQGLTEEEALAKARRAFGNVTKSRERFYDSRRWLLWDALRQDLRLAARLLARTPGWTAVAVLTVALGIGATAAIFSIVNAVLLRPLPYPHPKQLYAVADAKFGEAGIGLAADYFVIRENIRGHSSSSIEEVGAYDSGGVNWTGADRAERLVAGQVTASFFATLQPQPLYGRTFLPEEDQPGGDQVVVLSYSLWQRRFGGDASIVGRRIRIDRDAALVIGIMPASFDFPQGSDLWRPLALTEAQKMMRLVAMVARAKASASETEVQREFVPLTQAVVNQYPERGFSAQGVRFFTQPLQQTLTGDLRPALLVFSGAVGLMLLIVCFTVANLMLARATARGREIAVRVALGSPRRRIVSQLLTESLLVSLIGGAAGLGLAVLAVHSLNLTRKTALAGLPEVSIDLSTAAFALVVTVLTGIAFGIAPSLGSLGFGVRGVLRGVLQSESRTASSGSGLRRMRQILVVAQLGLSLTLLIGAGLLAKSFYGLRTRNPGYDAKNVLTARVSLAGPAYRDRLRQHEFAETLLDRVSRLPGVEAASIGAIPPGIAGNYGIFAIEGRPAALGQGQSSWKIDVSLDYFRVLGVPLKEGRAFERMDSPDSPLVVVVNEAFARKFFDGESALGHRVTSYTNDDWATIVGVVGDIHQGGLDQEAAPTAYRSFEQVADVSMTPRSNLLIRVSNDPAALIPTLDRVVAGIDRDQPVFDAKTLQRRLDDSLGSRRFDAALTGAFALIAMFLASIGVYGVMSYLVALRTSEIGIRLALGAQPGQVVGLIVREGALLGLIGVALGVGGALGLGRYLATLLYGVGTHDPATFGVAVLALFGAVLAACYVPSRRAGRVDAAIALRHI